VHQPHCAAAILTRHKDQWGMCILSLEIEASMPRPIFEERYWMASQLRENRSRRSVERGRSAADLLATKKKKAHATADELD